MSKDLINDITSSLIKSGNGDLASKWSKLAQNAGLGFDPNPNISNFARNTEPSEEIVEPKRVQHSYQVTIEGPENMRDIDVMQYITNISEEIPGVQVKGYQWLFKKEI